MFVRFSGLYRSLADALMRLLSRPQMRRFLLARLVRRAYAAANRRDFDFLLIGLDPAIEFHPRADLIAPDQDAVFYGHDGYREMWRTWLDAFEDLRLEHSPGVEIGLAESRAALESSKPSEELSRERLHQLRDLTILVRKRKLKPEKGRRKDLRKIDSLIEDLQLLVPNKIQR